MRLELKGIHSTSIDKPHMPDDPECCSVQLWAEVGPDGGKGSEIFYFTVVTPSFLVMHPETRWGKGYLLAPEFSWQEVERMVSRLVSSITEESWEEAAKVLGRYLEWEFENYQQ